MKMKKIVALLLAAALLLSLLAGCSGKNSGAEDGRGDLIAEEAASSQADPQTDPGETLPEEPAVNFEDFFGCWEYVDYDRWLYIYGDGAYEIFDAYSGNVTGSYLPEGVEVVLDNGGRLALHEEGGLVDDEGNRLFASELRQGAYPEAMPEDFELAVEDVPELVTDVLGIRELIYEDMPLFDSQEQVSVYALWNLLWGRTAFECRLTRELAPSEGEGHVVLDNACTAAMSYYLFSAYTPWDMYVAEDGDPDSVYAKVDLRYESPERDLEARAAALEYVMKNPAPEGGFSEDFSGYVLEMQYAMKIHDYVACLVTYDPRGYDPYDLLQTSRYDSLQEAYNVLGEGQDSAVCAAYARAFALIAQSAGINCAWVWGNETEETSHAWNVIYPCDGSAPVLVDVTWDDTMSEDVPGQTEVSDSYFYRFVSDDTEHQIDANMDAMLRFLNEGVG